MHALHAEFWLFSQRLRLESLIETQMRIQHIWFWNETNLQYVIFWYRHVNHLKSYWTYFHNNTLDSLLRKQVRRCERQLKSDRPTVKGLMPNVRGPREILWRASTDCSAPAKPQKRHTGLLSCRGCLRNETRTIIITSRERVALWCRFYWWRGSRRWRVVLCAPFRYPPEVIVGQFFAPESSPSGFVSQNLACQMVYL